MSWSPDFSQPIRILVEAIQQLIRGSWSARFEVAFWAALILIPAIFSPFESFIFALVPCLAVVLIRSGIWQFAVDMENKTVDDPVYKKNLQRLIERSRMFEESRNEPRS